MKKQIFICFLIISNFTISQTKEDTTVQWFKYIFKVDKSYLNKPYIRHQIYINNFGILKNIIKKGDLKKTFLEIYKEKNKFHIINGFDVTFIHITRNYPELIFNSEFIEFIEDQIKNYDFDYTLLIPSIQYYHYNLTYYDGKILYKNENPYAKKMDHQYDELFYEAIKRWGIEEFVTKH